MEQIPQTVAPPGNSLNKFIEQPIPSSSASIPQEIDLDFTIEENSEKTLINNTLIDFTS